MGLKSGSKKVVNYGRRGCFISVLSEEVAVEMMAVSMELRIKNYSRLLSFFLKNSHLLHHS